MGIAIIDTGFVFARIVNMKNCQCGKKYVPNPRGLLKFCSRGCFYKYRAPRPFGIKMNFTSTRSIGARFKRGMTPWNKGVKTGIVPPNFKGENVGYDALHDWVNRHKGKATCCVFCGVGGRIEWANKSHQYHRDLDDWISLCVKCHRNYDKGKRSLSARELLKLRK